MKLIKESLKQLCLSDKVYHPCYGEAEILKLEQDAITVKFKGFTDTFKTHGIHGDDRFIDELYDKPIRIVEI